MKTTVITKLFLVLSILLWGSNMAWADTTIGATDNTSDAWAANKYYLLKSNETLHVEFVNHNAGSGDNWNNFLIRFTNDETPTNVYGHYRADNFGWGTCYDGGLCQNNWDWTNFMTKLNGATVALDVIREDNIISIDAEVTTTSSMSYYQKYYADLGTTDDIYVCLSCEKSHIVIDDTKTTTTTTSYTNEGSWSWSHDLSAASDGVSVVGSGTFVSGDAYFGTVYQNVGTEKRTNYLQLPSTLLSHSKYTQKLTLGFWVNANNAIASSYDWTPIFSAYADAPSNNTNTSPMFVAQYRGLLQVNNSGWSNYVDAQNVNNTNAVYNNNATNNWLADNEWHYYTLVLDGNNAKVYFDGVLKNEWDASKSYDENEKTFDRCTQRGLFFFGNVLDYISLGGNQAWDWNDNDSPFKFAKFYASNSALSAAEIAAKMAEDMSVTASISSYGWATFSSDYALDFEHATDGLTAYKVTGHEGNVVTMESVNGTVPAGTGLLLKGDAGSYNIPIVGSSDTDMSDNLMVAGTGASVSAEAGKTKYVLSVNNNGTTDNDADDYAEFQKIVSTPATVAKGKAYLQFNTEINAPSLQFDFDFSTPTAIENLTPALSKGDGAVYNLNGQRVAQPKKGLYIVNGKKIIK